MMTIQAPPERTSTDAAPPSEPEREPYATMHKALVAVCAFFMAYLIVESVILLPFMLFRFGWQ